MMMMMIHQQQQQQQQQQQHPTVEIPPSWDPPPYDDHLSPSMFSPQTKDYFSALKRYLPSSTDFDDSDTDSSSSFDSFTSDNFRMYDFKVRKCARGRSHDWTECPYAHPGEKARRRDPRKYHYSGTACPDFRRGNCIKGDSCEFAHGVFECWLHPARYRTQPCKDGPHCKRRVCFFAHSPDQLRVLPDSPKFKFSPTSVFDSFPDSPPLSPTVSDLASAMRGLQVGPRNANLWGSHPRSPRGGGYISCSGGGSMPTTPTRAGSTRAGLGMFDAWDFGLEEEEVLPMERVESGRDLRARIYAKLSKENSLDNTARVDSVSCCVPDFEWVSELVN